LKRHAIAAAVIAALGTIAAPASAAVVIQLSGTSGNPGENVLFNADQSGLSVVAATNQTNTNVTFTNALGLDAQANGQATITNSGQDTLSGTTTFTIAAGSSFSLAEFNIPGVPGNPPPEESTSVFVQALGLDGTVIGSATLQPLSGTGQNFINVSGNAGELFTGVRLTLAPTGSAVGALQQVRLAGVSAVPEPTTWAMMLIGFGAVGYSMRRRKVSYGQRQLA
jgi:hypothetical protein